MALALHRPMRRSTPAGHQAAAGTADGTASRGRTRLAAARGAWAVGSFMVLLARIVRLITFIVVAIIAAAIILRVVGANAGNSIVHDVHDAGKALIGPFSNVFTPKGAKASIALNWGLAALVYLIVGTALAGFITRAAPAGTPPGRAPA
jgi:hypothetical protein